ncbi:hypothetical protein LTR70_010299 [Exophiala xenobiotica]|nr:hypothetical protein LTR70_010299 [Exophiala xenobiotica]
MVQGPAVALALLIAPSIIFVTLRYLTTTGLYSAATATTIWYGSYIAGVLVSMLAYRTFFHRLRHYPGSRLASLTQFHHVWNTKDRIDHYSYIDKLHKQYGDFVRIGPNLLSIADPAIVNIVYGPTTKFTKSDWYDAFTASALRSYDSRIAKHTQKLIQQLRRRVGTTVNAQEWIGFFAFDVMGDLAFGRTFEALELGKSHWFIDTIREGGLPIGLFGTTPWLLECVIRLPLPPSINPIVKLMNHSGNLVAERKRSNPAEEDVMSHILEAGEFFENSRAEESLLTSDARLLVVAGSDTTASTLTHVIYYIARDPTLATNLRAELAENNLRNDHSLTITSLAHLPFLNAVINEALRLHPPVPGGTYRSSPPGGIKVAGNFIPEGCVVLAPQYTIQRSSKAFTQPHDFIPERWTTRPELIRDKNAFFPFSLGRHGCIGKQLAYNEMRSVISRLVLEFDVAFAEGEDGRRLLEETQDRFTMGVAGLDLVFRERKA